MKSFIYRIEDPNGMHARPAGILAAQAKKFESSITVRFNEKKADAKRLLSLMSLGATHHSELIFEIEGADEEQALAALENFCRSGAFDGSLQRGNDDDFTQK